MELRAPAKINLTLEILSKRSDGYHEIRSVLQTINMADRLEFQPASDLSLEGDLVGSSAEDNLVLRAARLLQKEAGVDHGARITLRKVIPVAAGLGGGSSDAATTLRGLNELWKLDFPTSRLEALGAILGSDVPFFICGGSARVERGGGLLTALSDVPETWFLLFYLPSDLRNKTAEMYARVTPLMFSRGDRTRLLAAEIDTGKPISANHLCNVFEGVAFSEFPELREFYQEVGRAGATNVRLTGTGPALFCMVESEAGGRELLEKCDRRGLPVSLVKTVARWL
ncbi:MAG: 4-diphosphocytidyl-2-C-methyl-D-erythritol kinase [Dehalococcoidia bacterium]|nr:4-diphosphocytidyl-2-C-methyl-D-erythritol kinase [Dehalococcoidia bacterium]